MYLDHKNPDSIAHNIAEVRRDLARLRGRLQRDRMHPVTLDVRLCSDGDGNLWFATGDVQYDDQHGAACEAAEVACTTTDAELDSAACELVTGVADQLAEGEES